MPLGKPVLVLRGSATSSSSSPCFSLFFLSLLSLFSLSFVSLLLLSHVVISLSNRDTLALASAELESITKNLTVDSISPFLNCLLNTDSSAKSLVRKQCVILLTLMSHSHGNLLSPHISKMISTLSRRLRNPDSAVRSACVEATIAMSTNITKPLFSAMSKPLVEMLVTEQDINSQIGAAMCLSEAIEAAPDPDTEQLKKVLPKFGKLARTESFKAKAAVFGVIGSVASVGVAGSKGVLNWKSEIGDISLQGL